VLDVLRLKSKLSMTQQVVCNKIPISIFQVLIIVTFLILPFRSSSQNKFSISGKVVNGLDRKSLPGASIFLAKTSYGSQTDSTGQFVMSGLPAGKFKMVVSFIGFDPLIIDVQPQEEKHFTIILKPAEILLREVVVEGNGKDRRAWENNFAIFKENFIGQTENATKCTIVNPKVLHFNVKGTALTASSDSLLIIKNTGLGYTLKFLLEQFTYNNVARKVLYRGHVVFERMVAENEKQKLLWARNRLKAYYGSELHFMRALYNRKVIEEGFIFNLFNNQLDKFGVAVNQAFADAKLKVDSKIYKKKVTVHTINNYKRILDTLQSTPTHPVLKFTGQLEVKYMHESESSTYVRVREGRSPGFTRPQRSRLTLLSDDVSIEPNGTIIPEENIETVGYWSWEMVAESLPIDYYPEEDEKLLGESKVED
jgi:hypothetical protein